MPQLLRLIQQSLLRQPRLRKRAKCLSGNSGVTAQVLEQRRVFSGAVISVAKEAIVKEGQEHEVVITRSGDLSQSVTVNYSFVPLTADAGEISRAKGNSGTVVFEPGIRTFRLSPMKAIDDKIHEPMESVYVRMSLGQGSNAKLGNSSLLLLIEDNDPAPRISISSLTPPQTKVGEGSGKATFRVSLDSKTEKAVSFTLEGRSTGWLNWGEDAYFMDNPQSSSAKYTIPRGQNYLDVTVGIKEDKVVEGDETITVALVGASGVSGYGNSQAKCTIQDNDIPTVIIEDAPIVTEGHAPGAKAQFNVRVQEKMERAVDVKYFTSGDTANSTSDYVAAAGTLKFGVDPKTYNVTQQHTVSIALRADKIAESTEGFYLGLAAVDSTPQNKLNLPRKMARGTILDDDQKTQVGIPAPKSATPTPENGFGMVLYSWAAASNAARYEISVRKENSFFGESYDSIDSFDFSYKPITGTTYSPLYSSWLSEGTYIWKVRAVAADGTKGEWSEGQKFEMPKKYAAN